VARTRAQRRRQTLRLVLALALTFIVVVFGREVSRSAHAEAAARTNENLSFAALATNLLVRENAFDSDVATLLTTGTHLSREAFAVRFSDLTQELASWRAMALQMRQPVLSPDLNDTLASETLTRVADYETVLGYVAQGLTLAGPAWPGGSSLGRAQLSLGATAASWGAQRHALAGAPGKVTLAALTDVGGHLNIPQYVQTLVASTNLAPTRAIVIAAVQVQPAPFPAPALTLSLAPTTTMQVQVAVSNLREILQGVTVSMVFTPASGSAQRVVQSGTLAPMASYAFPSRTFTVHPGESGTFTVTLNGAPATSGLVHQRAYAVSVAPSANG
jgi:hypothetical protein